MATLLPRPEFEPPCDDAALEDTEAEPTSRMVALRNAPRHQLIDRLLYERWLWVLEQVVEHVGSTNDHGGTRPNATIH